MGACGIAQQGRALPLHLSARCAPAAISRGIHAALTNVWAGIALVRRHLQGTPPCARTSSWQHASPRWRCRLPPVTTPRKPRPWRRATVLRPTCRRRNIRGSRRSISLRVNRWPDGAKPIAANGMTVTAFATGLEHPRTVYVLPNGDVLVAESNAPPKPDDGKGIKGFIYRQAQKWAGAGVPSANRITLLRDADGDGVAETRSTFPQRPEFAVRHGAGRRGFLCRQFRCDHEIPLSDRRHQDQRARRQACGPARRHAQSPLDQGPHRQPRRHEALCNRRLQQQCRRKRHRGREGSRRGAGSRPRQRPMARVCLGLAQPERSVMESEDRRALGRRQRARRTRQRSRSRLHDLGEGSARSTAGRTAITAITSTRASSRDGPTWCRKRWRRIMRSARIRLRLGSPSTPAICFRPRWKAAPSSASTARGIASPAPATR